MRSRARTVAAIALWYTTVQRHSSLLQTLQVLLSTLGPGCRHNCTLGLRAEVIANLVGLVKLALEVDVGVGLWQLFLGGDQKGFEVIETERTLEVLIRCLRASLAIDLEGLTVRQLRALNKVKVRLQNGSRQGHGLRQPSEAWPKPLQRSCPELWDLRIRDCSCTRKLHGPPACN